MSVCLVVLTMCPSATPFVDWKRSDDVSGWVNLGLRYMSGVAAAGCTSTAEAKQQQQQQQQQHHIEQSHCDARVPIDSTSERPASASSWSLLSHCACLCLFEPLLWVAVESAMLANQTDGNCSTQIQNGVVRVREARRQTGGGRCLSGRQARAQSDQQRAPAAQWSQWSQAHNTHCRCHRMLTSNLNCDMRGDGRLATGSTRCCEPPP